MSQGPDAHREALIAQFSTITGATPERARFYLEAAAWDFAVREIQLLTRAIIPCLVSRF